MHVAGALGLNGWRVGNTTVGWTYYDNESGIIWSSPSCDTDTVVSGDHGEDLPCTVRNGAGTRLTGEYTVKLDKTPPTVAAQPSRPADANGWFNHGVGFTAQAQDAFSGVDRCDLPSYDGPDSAHATVTVPCFDRAGHRGTATPGFMYDDTAPTVRAALARRPDRYGWYAKDVRVSFAGSDATSRIDGCSSSVYRGPDTARASVTGWCRDRAGNQSSITRSFKFSKPLLEPIGRRVTSPPLLDWVDVAQGARVQRPGLARRAQDPQPVARRVQMAAGPALDVPGGDARAEARRELPGVRVATLPERLRRAARAGRIQVRPGLGRRRDRSSGGRTRTYDTRIMIPLL